MDTNPGRHPEQAAGRAKRAKRSARRKRDAQDGPIHTGEVDADKHRDDFYFLQELVELWLLTILDCPDTAINTRAFRKFILAR
jgi:hypothetical protein